jgi:hypothetical protein
MKKLLLSIALFTSVSAFAQEQPTDVQLEKQVRKMELKAALNDAGSSLKSSQTCFFSGLLIMVVGGVLTSNNLKGYNQVGTAMMFTGGGLMFASHFYFIRSGNKLKEASTKF